MRHTTINNFCDFEFHDTVFKFICFDDSDLIINANHLNIHKKTTANTNDYDMEIESAKIIFKNFTVDYLEPIRAYNKKTNGELYTDEPKVIYKEQEAEKFLLTALKKHITLNGLIYRNENEKIIFEIETNAPIVFSALCSCTEFNVEWDEYCGKSWYEKSKP